MQKTIVFFLSIIGFSLLAQTAFAQTPTTECVPIFGGGNSCEQNGDISVNKAVLNPKTNAFVDSLNQTDPRYAPGFNIAFQIIVTNKTDREQSKIEVRDILPQYVILAQGPLSFTIDKLGKKESKKYTITGRIVPEDQIPNPIICATNQVETVQNGKVSRDNAQFCIQKGQAEQSMLGTQTQTPPQTQTSSTLSSQTKGGMNVEPAPKTPTTPATGPELLPLISLIPAGLAGFYLRRKSSP